MSLGLSPWALPGLEAFIARVFDALKYGLAVVLADEAQPSGFETALRASLVARHFEVDEVEVLENQPPLLALADRFEAPARIADLRSTKFDQRVAIIAYPGGHHPADHDRWRAFLSQYKREAQQSLQGLCIVVLGAPEGLVEDSLNWVDALGRGDLVIWAEEHLPPTRIGLIADLAVHLSSEICSWRLDLASELVRASVNELSDIESWLASRKERPILGDRRIRGIRFACPLVALGCNAEDLRRRTWRAHLAAVFPWLEERRLEIVSSHRSHLKVDQRLRDLGVQDPEDIELGALWYQLKGRLSLAERDRLASFARIRNALAHRRPVSSNDLRHCLAL